MAKKARKAKTTRRAKAKTARATRKPAAKAKRARPVAKRRVAARRPPAKRPPATRAAAAARRDPMRELAKRIVDLTLAEDEAGMFALYADDVESVEMGMPPGVGIEAIRQKFVMWRSMVSDATWKARTVVVDGNTIVIEWQGRVTLASNGRTVDLNEVALHEIKNGKIVRERFYYDPSVLQQAAAPVQPAAAPPS